MQGDYRMLVREQLICGIQVHVDVMDRDLAVAAAHRVAPWLPGAAGELAVLARNRHSYASYRALSGALGHHRFPGRFASAADYDQTVADLVRSEVITDPGMIYSDIRPSAHLPMVELRICDASPRLGDVVLLAGLFRALVIRETGAALAGRALSAIRPELFEAATWRAAQSGMEGNLVDPATATPVPAHQLIRQLLAELRLALEASGDWELVTGLTESALARGSSAARQRAACARGGLPKVVDTLLTETRADTGWLPGRGIRPHNDQRVAAGPGGSDGEAILSARSARRPYRIILPALSGPEDGVAAYQAAGAEANRLSPSASERYLVMCATPGAAPGCP
jgi:glutamate---cysteine ligase / carboxylate-amine ligase